MVNWFMWGKHPLYSATLNISAECGAPWASFGFGEEKEEDERLNWKTGSRFGGGGGGGRSVRWVHQCHSYWARAPTLVGALECPPLFSVLTACCTESGVSLSKRFREIFLDSSSGGLAIQQLLSCKAWNKTGRGTSEKFKQHLFSS